MGISVEEVLGAVIGAVLGAVFGGLLTYIVTVRAARISNRRTLTLRLYEEWHTLEMLEARICTHEMLKLYNEDSFTELYSRLEQSGNREAWIKVSRSIHFFELLGMMLSENQLDTQTFWRLFGRYVRYWRSEMLDGLMSRSEARDRGLESGWTQSVKRLEEPTT